ncbi:Alpha-L-fucosidase [Proteiniphilum saccharofermentans]|uniref:alpha-L-fucosidase n=1 Tax=Proteiniphilum saccharofermentans TaxID=1642647 RepID=A0A1R3SYZ0_9BACT|nr:alpha-L-fucosidase [Proteiniphilum saccharofermentans]SCD21406.1 Alpha-L-fucosidase [Proteiniphilum saccharofermentans]
MKQVFFVLVIFSMFYMASIAQNKGDEQAMQQFQDSKFGLFIHWGLYSQTAGLWKGVPSRGGEHFMLYEKIPLKEYAAIAKEFNPTQFNATQWVKTAKQAGMKYIVFTTKHHDGFAMYDSKVSDYNIVKTTPYGKDPLKELAKACKDEGIMLGLYYSLGRDWEDPDVPTNWPEKAGRSNTWDYPDEDAKDLNAYIERKVKPQLVELLTNYGDIAMIWFDTPELVTEKQSGEIRELIESIQPTCLINSRIGNNLGDYSIKEQQLTDEINPNPWETCITMGKNWGYNQFDTVYKEPEILIRSFVDVVSKGGNLLLNIGPTRKGTFPSLTRPGLDSFHNWMEINSEAIYETRPWHIFGEDFSENQQRETVDKEFHDAVFDAIPKDKYPDFRFTTKEGCLYIIARHVYDTDFVIKSLDKTRNIKQIGLLDEGYQLNWEYVDGGVRIQVPSDMIQKQTIPIYTIKVEL